MKTVKIKDLGRTVTGHTPPTSESKYFGDYMPFVKPTDIDKESKYTYKPEQYYSEEAADKYKSSLIPKGSTCVVCIGTIGEKMTMAHCDLFTNQSINSIIPSKDYDPDYVYYLLKYNLGKVKALNKGTASGREFVSKSTFLEMNVEVHEDLLVQKRIGHLLSAYDDLIISLKTQISLLEESAVLLYNRFLVSNNGSWTIGRLGDIAIYSGNTQKKSNRDKFLYYLPIDCLPKKSLAYYETNDVSLAESSLVSFKDNDFLFGAMRPYFHKVVIARDEGLTRNTCFVINAIDPDYWGYLAMLLFSDSTVQWASQNSVGATMPYVRWKDFSGMKIQIPNALVASSFNKCVQPLLEEIKVLARQSVALKQARDSLLPKLMSSF